MSRYIDEHRGRFGVEPICEIHAANYYAYGYRKCGWRCGAPARASVVTTSSA